MPMLILPAYADIATLLRHAADYYSPYMPCALLPLRYALQGAIIDIAAISPRHADFIAAIRRHIAAADIICHYADTPPLLPLRQMPCCRHITLPLPPITPCYAYAMPFRADYADDTLDFRRHADAALICCALTMLIFRDAPCHADIMLPTPRAPCQR